MNATSLSPKAIALLLALLLLLAVSNAFYSYRLTTSQQNIEFVVNSHGDQLRKLNQNLEQSSAAYSELENELAYAKERLGTAQIELRKAQQSSAHLARQQKEVASKWGERLSKLQQEQAAAQGAIGNLSSDIAGVKTGLSSAHEQITSTRSELQRAIGDLGVQSGLIARSRADLDELRLRGERDYYEFEVAKSKRPERVGNVSIALKKTDQKRQRYSINVISDDRTIEKKDKTANEPVQFYQAGFRQPTEIVVNRIHKDRIAGYLAVPKKRDSRLQGSASSELPPSALTMSRSDQPQH
ncbi:MAG: hypothetical protein HYX72_11810 [Acidobacteria bacterium]|nr:hypothetical protein [Acidobacteriota bacterium]